MSDDKKIIRVERENLGDAEREDNDDPMGPAVGRWFWHTYTEKKWNGKKYERVESTELKCCMHVGSNYVELKEPGQSGGRVHINKFFDTCRREMDPEGVIAKEIKGHQHNIAGYMAAIQAEMNKLGIGVSTGPALAAQGETQALARMNTSATKAKIDAYKQALVKSKDKTIPDLFAAIKNENEWISAWMKATLLPIQAQVAQLEPVKKVIEARIFNVDLYAGLSEEIKQIAIGEPAEVSEPVHLFQRRLYMDEECLVRYQTGGMTFHELSEFDAWIVRPENLGTILPQPRAIVAFKIRREEKERHFDAWTDWLRFVMSGEEELDKLTFLYMRNGDKVFRLGTTIDFGSQLFPDQDKQSLDEGQSYAIMRGSEVKRVITEGEYLEMRKQHAKNLLEYRADVRDKTKKWHEHKFHSRPSMVEHGFGRVEKYERDNVYYDDIQKHIKDEIDAHNRLVLVLQGIFDRSPVMHPHPTWRLWSPEGFGDALRLIYDDARALYAGAKPDFDLFRQRLNSTANANSTFVGQELYWLRAMAVKYNERNRNRDRDFRERETYRPSGNPGPGFVAQCVNLTKRGATFKWKRKKQKRDSAYDRWGDYKETEDSITVPLQFLVHVDAYSPGDFHVFFDDPRTRADYLRWAPSLLACEEWHAGNRTGKPTLRPDPETKHAREWRERNEHQDRLREQREQQAKENEDDEDAEEGDSGEDDSERDESDEGSAEGEEGEEEEAGVQADEPEDERE